MDVRGEEGLLDLLALGNLLEISHTWELQNEFGSEDSRGRTQRQHITSLYSRFQQEFSRRQRLKLKTSNACVDPVKFLFGPSILQLGVGIIQYKTSMKGFDTQLKVPRIKESLLTHFKRWHHDLVPLFLELLAQPAEDLEFLKTF